MILGSFFQFLKHIDIGGFFSPLNISLGHNNLEMQTNTQTWIVYLLYYPFFG
jgi:hypothetical protein